MRREYAKTAAVRNGIVSACAATFARTGFHGVSMAQIARSAGVSHTGLLHHFPRKEDLLRAVLSRQDENMAAALELASDHDRDPAETLHRVLGTLVQRERHAGLVELGAVLTGEASVRDHPAHKHFADRYRGMRSFVANLLEELRAQGRLDSELSSEELATTVIALAEGAHLQWLYERDDRVVDVDVILHHTLAGLVPELA